MRFADALRLAVFRAVPTVRGTYMVEIEIPARLIPVEDLERSLNALFNISKFKDIEGTIGTHQGFLTLRLRETSSLQLAEKLAYSPVFRQSLIRALDMGVEAETRHCWHHVCSVLSAPDAVSLNFGSNEKNFLHTLRTLILRKAGQVMLGAAAGAILLTAGVTYAIKNDWLQRALGEPLLTSYVHHVATKHVERMREVVQSMEEGQPPGNMDQVLRSLQRWANDDVRQAIRGVELVNASAYKSVFSDMLLYDLKEEDIRSMEAVRAWYAEHENKVFNDARQAAKSSLSMR